MIQIEEIHKGGRCFAFDSNFLADFAAWDRELALLLAVEEGVTMQEDSWKACHILREVFALEQAPPVQRVLMKRFAAAVGREDVAFLSALSPRPGAGATDCRPAQACPLLHLTPSLGSFPEELNFFAFKFNLQLDWAKPQL